MELSVLILAAGKGTRMKSVLPKVMQPLASRPLLAHVLKTAHDLESANTLVVYGHGGDVVRNHFAGENLGWVLQAEQKGTGHAVQVALPQLPATGKTLILYGDVPLTSVQTLQLLMDQVRDDNSLGLLSVHLDNPTGYGRIVRDAAGKVQRIVEQKDASDTEKLIREVNTGILCVPNRHLHDWLPNLGNSNAQGEYYLTDIIAMAVAAGVAVRTTHPAHAWEVEGVNDKLQLATLERVYQRQQAETLMRAGVTLLDPARLDVRGVLSCGLDVEIDVNSVFEGTVTLGDNVRIGPNCVLKDCTIGAGSVIRANSVIEESVIGQRVQAGPFARIRPGSTLADDVHIGNFVEVKNSRFDQGAKANHLAYIGDADIGARANIGAGTITCNYDGAFKHRTVVGEDAFIGSNSSLIAPVKIGQGATTGAGSAISKDVPPAALAVARGLQRNIENWDRPRKPGK
ncbi:bifunctional UDP-N-acetylglucosamine pyrophosphorylase/glucosamine-1-phosphate N-acetyltransferase [Fluviicoccus keumensis]|uniref:Bifunctional protein GlmU n=1 Tax=Fluviicoccus keumensis TaxID=1435465 RepID=A0A4Q7ZB33_9GAMM|nr:bifunctional UDP-N-acetylglucosamine diphosphorylase/glucosamine-1-phosphate N-acetyltransferase GlmU [Fluviicoccus keumensis]RZU47788.1 bifunctional UDP-N-acetylglucosamine pyrophosphorylase/glucosamine-1-phosphate N-acetyltransferase [Fluviicoccus keumensis]